MKTQLLEDIGQNANFSFTPPKAGGTPKAEQDAAQVAPAVDAPAASSRAARGVWRQNPAGQAPGDAAPQTIQQPAALAEAPALPEESTAQELDRLVEELAALEAQLVPPGERQEPALAPADAAPAPSLHPVAAPSQSAIPASEAEPDPIPVPMRGAGAPREPSFDFTPPAPARQAAEPFIADPVIADPTVADPVAAGPAVAEAPGADPFTPAARGFSRSGPRYLAWAACLLAAVLLVLGGRWWYQERRDAGALALIAGAAKEDPRPIQGLAAAAPAVPQGAQEAGVDAAAPAPAAARRPSAAVPPLVMLEEQPGVPVKREQPAQAAVGGQAPAPAPAPVAAGKPAAAVQEAPVTPAPKPKAQTPPTPKTQAAPKPKAQTPAKPNAETPAKPKAQTAPKAKAQTAPKAPGAAAAPAKQTRQREPVRQVARAPAAANEAPLDAEDSLSETLKACRAHGYHATQCIKQGCSMTKYGFVCRGR